MNLQLIVERLLCGQLIFIALIPQCLIGEELKSGCFKWETIHGVISAIENSKIIIQDSTGKTDFAEIGLGPNRLSARNVPIRIGQTITIMGMRERRIVDAVFFKTDTLSLYRYNNPKDSVLSLKLRVSLEDYQAIKEMQGYQKRAEVSKGVMVFSCLLGAGLIIAGASKIHQGKQIDPNTIFLLNGDIVMGTCFVLGGMISAGRGLIFIIPSVTQKHKYNAMHSLLQ